MPGNTKIPEKSGGQNQGLAAASGKPLQAVRKPERPKALLEAEPEFSSGFVRISNEIKA